MKHLVEPIGGKNRLEMWKNILQKEANETGYCLSINKLTL